MLAVDRAVQSARFPPHHRHGIPSLSFHERLFREKPPTIVKKASRAILTRPRVHPSPPMSGSPPFRPATTAPSLTPPTNSPRQNLLSDTSHTTWSIEQQQQQQQQHQQHQQHQQQHQQHQQQQQQQTSTPPPPWSTQHRHQPNISQTTWSPQHQLHQQPSTTPSRQRPYYSPSTNYSRDTHQRRLPPLMTSSLPESARSHQLAASRQPYVSPALSTAHKHSPLQLRGPVPEPRHTSSPPRSQRKTKGHVASACVPCKKAHLRCDAQRPCCRCIAHGKEDACVDVQHKKRGRPRLRDDRESRMESVSRFATPHPHETSAVARRHSNIRPAATGRSAFYGSNPRRVDSAAAAMAPPLSGSAAAATYTSPAHDRYPAPPLPAEEPVIYMRTSMEVVKVSPSFSEAVGGSASSFVGRNITDMVTPEASDTMTELHLALSAEQKRREPTYLPPIFDRGDDTISSLGFSSENVARLDFTHQAFVAFRSHGGPPRSFSVGLALFKQGSFFFIALLLRLGSRPTAHHSHPHPPPPPQPYLYRQYHQQQRPPPSVASPSSSRDLHLLRTAAQGNCLTDIPPHDAPMMDMDMPNRLFGDAFPAQQQQQRRDLGMTPSQGATSSPGSSTYQSIYSPPPRAGDPPPQPPQQLQYNHGQGRPSPRQQIPRSEAGAPPRRHGPVAAAQYTLPPIRSLGEQTGQAAEKDDKQKRVTIGGLINRPGSH